MTHSAGWLFLRTVFHGCRACVCVCRKRIVRRQATKKRLFDSLCLHFTLSQYSLVPVYRCLHPYTFSFANQTILLKIFIWANFVFYNTHEHQHLSFSLVVRVDVVVVAVFLESMFWDTICTYVWWIFTNYSFQHRSTWLIFWLMFNWAFEIYERTFHNVHAQHTHIQCICDSVDATVILSYHKLTVVTLS